MVSDILTAVIVLLMAVLVIYPTTRVLLRSWHNWHRRRARLEAPHPLRDPPAQGRARPAAGPHRRAEHDDHVEGFFAVAAPGHRCAAR